MERVEGGKRRNELEGKTMLLGSGGISALNEVVGM